MTRPCLGASNPNIPLIGEHTVSHFLTRLSSGAVILAPAELLESTTYRNFGRNSQSVSLRAQPSALLARKFDRIRLPPEDLIVRWGAQGLVHSTTVVADWLGAARHFHLLKR